MDVVVVFRDYPGESVPEKNLLLDFTVQGDISEADTLTIRLGATPSGLISEPPPSSAHLYAGCPSCHNPPNLFWLGTGTKYVLGKAPTIELTRITEQLKPKVQGLSRILTVFFQGLKFIDMKCNHYP